MVQEASWEHVKTHLRIQKNRKIKKLITKTKNYMAYLTTHCFLPSFGCEKAVIGGSWHRSTRILSRWQGRKQPSSRWRCRFCCPAIALSFCLKPCIEPCIHIHFWPRGISFAIHRNMINYVLRPGNKTDCVQCFLVWYWILQRPESSNQTYILWKKSSKGR